jgi:hypothetical protein
MTTPEDKPARVRRTPPARSGPDRTGAAAAAPPSSFGEGATGPAPPVRDSDELHINEAVAGSVKTAYDVFAQTVAQGRKAAEQFREGDYRIDDVPQDVRIIAARLLGLARQLSATTFDVCEALLNQSQGAAGPPPPGMTPVPPFRETVRPIQDAPPSPAQPMHKPGEAGRMALSVVFTGSAQAAAHTTALDRPKAPTRPDEITAASLTSRAGNAPPLTGVTFAADLSHGGLVASVTVPAGQPNGIYSGPVYAGSQDLPLGLLVIELTG